MAAPLAAAGLVLLVSLAITLICSAMRPSIYTHLLVLSDFSTRQYYGYTALYVLLLMLDSFVVFGLVAFAAQRIVDTRYAPLIRVVGGTVLIGLGIWMLNQI